MQIYPLNTPFQFIHIFSIFPLRMKKSLLYHVNTSLIMIYCFQTHLFFNYRIFSIKFLFEIPLNTVRSSYIFDHIMISIFNEEIDFIFVE